MKLSEIRAALERHNAIVQAGPMLGEEFSDYSQRVWDSKPRIPFDELPASLQKIVRDHYPPQKLRDFLASCYTTPEFEKMVRAMTPQQLDTLPNKPETFVSFQTMVNGISDTALDGLLIRARNTAVYTIETDRNAKLDVDKQLIIFPKGNESTAIVPALYGDHICAAFESVLSAYRDAEAQTPDSADNQQNNEIIPIVLPSVVQPVDITAPKDKVSRMFFRGEIPLNQPGRVISGDEIPIKDENGKTVKVHIAPIVGVSLLDLPPNVSVSRKPQPIDNIVHARLCSLFMAGNRNFTGQAIYTAMTGNPGTDATPDWLAVIDESWTRLTTTQISIDTGTMGNAYNFKRWQRQRAAIMGGKDIVTVGNQFGQTTTTTYTITEKPILYEYAEALDQINRYPRIMQNTPVNKTIEIMVLQNALLDHINAIPKISNHIRYDTLWSILNIEATPPADEAPDIAKKRKAVERKKKTVLRGYIHKMLDYWKDTGFISGWTEETKGKVIQSIVIAKPKKPEVLPPAKKK